METLLRVDDQDTTLSEFIEINTNGKDVHHITPEDAHRVKTLKEGESIYINTVKVTRLFDHVRTWLEAMTTDQLDELYIKTIGNKPYHMSKEGYVRSLHPRFELCGECTGAGCKRCRATGFDIKIYHEKN